MPPLEITEGRTHPAVCLICMYVSSQVTNPVLSGSGLSAQSLVTTLTHRERRQHLLQPVARSLGQQVAAHGVHLSPADADDPAAAAASTGGQGIQRAAASGKRKRMRRSLSGAKPMLLLRVRTQKPAPGADGFHTHREHGAG